MDLQENYRKARNFCAGYCSGVALVLVGHPFDTIKVRLQTEGTKGRFNGLVDCIKTTIVNEGVTGLYKGLMAPLLATGVINSILFGIQFNILQAMTLHREGHLGAHLSSSELRNKATVGDTCAAAVLNASKSNMPVMFEPGSTQSEGNSLRYVPSAVPPVLGTCSK